MPFFLSRRQNVIEVFRAKDSAQQGFYAPSVGFNCRSRDSAAENNKESFKGKEQRDRHFAHSALPFLFSFVRLRLESGQFRDELNGKRKSALRKSRYVLCKSLVIAAKPDAAPVP